MKHRNGNKKLSKPTDQRLALLKTLTFSLVKNKKIITTTTRAKQTKRFAEKLITIAKSDSLASKRHILKIMNNKTFLKELYNLKERYSKNNGGYLRIIKCGTRKGDASEISLLELT